MTILTSDDGLSVQNAVAQFIVDVLGSGVDVAINGDGSVPGSAPWAVVSIVSDVDVSPTDTLIDVDASTVRYTSHRQVRAQVSIRGGIDSGGMAQTLALHWRADSPAARASIARGLAPSTAPGVRVNAAAGDSGPIVSASVDLAGYYRQTTAPIDDPDALVDLIDVDLTGAEVSDPDIVGEVTVPPDPAP